MTKYIITAILILVACNTTIYCHNTTPPKVDTIAVHDTVYMPADTARYTQIIDSLEDEIFIRQYKIERVKYYLSIVDRNPSQIKFLKGWVRRAVK